MKGAHQVHIAGRRADFKFEVRRSITVVRGDSGSGKTTLYELVAAHTRYGESSGVSVQCPKACVAIVDIDWRNQLASVQDSIVFIDEGARFVASEDFARAIQHTDNYYVIFTREDLHELPYSIDEIYQIKTSGKKYHTFERLYKPHDNHVYSLAPRQEHHANYDTLITEDARSGFEFYENRLASTGIACESAGSNARIYRCLKEASGGRVFVVADGAAFGAEADRVLKLQDLHPTSITICLPESFEWLLLRSGIVNAPDLEEVLVNTAEHVYSESYFSWERFYAAYLKKITDNTPFEYSKRRLADAYKIPENAEKIIAEIATQNIR